MNAADTVSRLATGTYTLRRAAATTYGLDGVAVVGARTDSPFTAVVYPADGRALKALPELERAEEGIVVITAALLRTVDQAAKTAADLVVYLGREYKVVNVQAWAEAAGVYRCVATRVGQ